ncbi:metallopeptidase family protein [Gephyromycinifex aptenodytis]|uniref:metallopeptidase family protein n=1 Tax=Gephyromycinifex aptenodytis TaxID=2716227 RepID=UPI00144882F9|nr:metallopeptidase family protein [Gephyromycinifex aptenodytis]
MDLTGAEFEALVSDALDAVPAELLDLLENVVFLIEDEPPTGFENVLGLYEGIPRTERDLGWGQVILPDRITIYRGPTLRMCATEKQVADEVAITVVHEIAHHFGIDDERLHALGWG